MKSIRTSLLTLCLAVLALTGCRSAGEMGNETDQLVERSRVTFQSMMSDTQYPGLVDLAARAKAIIIVPSMIRAAFFIGGRGGNAVMLVRDEEGHWSNPAFYTLSGMSFGLQFGGQASEIVITVMTEKGLRAIMERQVTLGGDAGLAVGELGQGVHAATGMGLKSDLYSFARSEGLYAGVSLDGSVIAPRHTMNHSMYGSGVTPRSILVNRTATTSSQAVANLLRSMP